MTFRIFFIKNLSKKTISQRNSIEFFFFVFLESSEMYADRSLNEIGAKLIFFSRKISSQKLIIKILLNKKNESENCFAYVSEHCASFGTKNNWATFEEVCMSFARK